MQRQKNTESTNLVELLVLGLIWLVIFASPVIILDGNGNVKWDMVFETWKRLFPFLVLSLLNHFILVPFLFFRNMTRYFAITLVIIVLFSLSLSWMQGTSLGLRQPQSDRPMTLNWPPHKPGMEDENRLPPPDGDRMGPKRNPPVNLPPFLNTFIIALLIMGFDTGIRAIFKGSKTEKEKEILEKEKVKSELAFLRNQISPHFFMNTLNNIHSLIDLDTQGAKDAIIRLSKLMQHLLYDSEMETIPLQDEIAFIQSYIELMKLRFTEKVRVSLEIHSDESGVNIPPLLFTSLLENAFKFGVSYKEKSFIDISLVTRGDKLIFKIANSIIPGRKQIQNPATSGIGLYNTRKRLDLLYSNHYKMNVSDTDGVFLVTLILPV